MNLGLLFILSLAVTNLKGTELLEISLVRPSCVMQTAYVDIILTRIDFNWNML